MPTPPEPFAPLGDTSAEGVVRPELRAELERRLSAAREKEQAGDASGALALLEQAPAELGRFGIYHFALGSLRARAGDLDGAVTAFERAADIDPEIPEYRGNLGAALLQGAYRRDTVGRPQVSDSTRLGRALEILEVAARDRPRLPDVYNNYGLALLLDDQRDDAMRSFEAALAIDPGHLPSLYNSAIALHVLGREEECLAQLERCLEIDPGFEPARRSRASTLERLGR